MASPRPEMDQDYPGLAEPSPDWAMAVLGQGVGQIRPLVGVAFQLALPIALGHQQCERPVLLLRCLAQCRSEQKPASLPPMASPRPEMDQDYPGLAEPSPDWPMQWAPPRPQPPVHAAPPAPVASAASPHVPRRVRPSHQVMTKYLVPHRLQRRQLPPQQLPLQRLLPRRRDPAPVEGWESAKKHQLPAALIAHTRHPLNPV